jgi:hypothetical protein
MYIFDNLLQTKINEHIWFLLFDFPLQWLSYNRSDTCNTKHVSDYPVNIGHINKINDMHISDFQGIIDNFIL